MLNSYRTTATHAEVVGNTTPLFPVAPEMRMDPKASGQPRTKGRILLIEPAPRWREQLQLLLERAGHTVIVAVDGVMGLVQFTLEKHIDLVLVASHMPGLSGLTVCVSIRRHSNVPVILLSDTYQLEDALFSLQVGADDYMARSTQWPILLARLQARLQRAVTPRPRTKAQVLVVKDLVVDHHTGTVTKGRQLVNLTPIEHRLLLYLIEQAARTVGLAELLQAVWGYGIGDTGLVRVAIYRLRKKIESDPEHPTYVVKSHGGYQFCPTARL